MKANQYNSSVLVVLILFGMQHQPPLFDVKLPFGSLELSQKHIRFLHVSEPDIRELLCSYLTREGKKNVHTRAIRVGRYVYPADRKFLWYGREETTSQANS